MARWLGNMIRTEPSRLWPRVFIVWPIDLSVAQWISNLKVSIEATQRCCWLACDPMRGGADVVDQSIPGSHAA